MGGRSVENSPFPLNVVQPNTAVVRLRQPEEAEKKYLVRRELDIALDAGEGARNITANVEGPDNENVPCTLENGDDGLYHVKFVPYQPGDYKVSRCFPCQADQTYDFCAQTHYAGQDLRIFFLGIPYCLQYTVHSYVNFNLIGYSNFVGLFAFPALDLGCVFPVLETGCTFSRANT